MCYLTLRKRLFFVSIRYDKPWKINEDLVRGSYEKYSIEEKKALAEVVKTCKIEYEAEVERLKGKYHWDAKPTRHANQKREFLLKRCVCFTLIYHLTFSICDLASKTYSRS